MRPLRYLAIGLLAAAFACSTADATAPTSAPEADFTEEGVTLPLPADVLRVPLIRQRRDYTCGDVALLSVLRFWKPDAFKDTTESALIGPLGTTSCNGTEPKSIAAFASKQDGLRGELRTDATTDDLDASLSRGEPVIVDLEAWQDLPRIQDFKPWDTDYDDGHYVVLVGAGKATLPPPEARQPGHAPKKTPTSLQDVYYFMDPSTTGNFTYIPKAEFESRWHDGVADGTGQVLHAQHVAIFVKNIGGLTPRAVTPRSRNVTPID
jgi:predicted double-glycine peptidase